jgi:hypothetical protein
VRLRRAKRPQPSKSIVAGSGMASHPIKKRREIFFYKTIPPLF